MRQLRQLQRPMTTDDYAVYEGDIEYLDNTDETGRSGEFFPPTEWTEFWAGSLEKVEIMRKRLEAGEHLHHPYDCKQIIVSDQDRVKHSRNGGQVRWLSGRSNDSQSVHSPAR